MSKGFICFNREKKYKCLSCKKFFGSRKSIRVHLKKVHKVRTSQSYNPKNRMAALSEHYKVVDL